eukprot:Em0020g412a
MSRVLSEIADVLGDRKEVTADDLDKLKYTEQVIQEVLRMYPPAAFISKESPKGGMMMSGYQIPEYSQLMFSNSVMCRNPEYFNDPDTFDPSRFDADKTRPGPFVYFPFSVGHRSCIGRHFAMIEAKLILARLLQTFKRASKKTNYSTLMPSYCWLQYKFCAAHQSQGCWKFGYLFVLPHLCDMECSPYGALHPLLFLSWPDLLAMNKRSGNDHEPFATMIAKWTEEVGELFVLFFIYDPLVASSNPADVKRIASGERIDKASSFIKPITTLFGKRFAGQSLLAIPNYETWKPKRKLYDPSFKRSSLKDRLSMFNECANTLLERLRPLADGKTEVSMKEAFHEMALDAISKLFHPHETKMYREAVDAMRTIGRDCIEKRIKAVTSGEEVPNDILTQILHTTIADKSVDLESLVDDFIAFYVAARDACPLEGHMPNSYDRLLSEIEDVIGDRKEVTGDDLDKLKYTEQVVQEVLRMYPPVDSINKDLPKED